jgi:hypothetical protein
MVELWSTFLSIDLHGQFVEILVYYNETQCSVEIVAPMFADCQAELWLVANARLKTAKMIFSP